MNERERRVGRRQSLKLQRAAPVVFTGRIRYRKRDGRILLGKACWRDANAGARKGSASRLYTTNSMLQKRMHERILAYPFLSQVILENAAAAARYP